MAICSSRVGATTWRITCAGTPPTSVFAGTLVATKEFTITVAPAPMVTPGNTNAVLPMKTWSPISIGPNNDG